MNSLNETADTYALGMLLYQIYNDGNLPFKDKAPAEVLPTPCNADYEIAEIIMKAVAPDPADRWNDPLEMGKALAAYLQRNTVNNTPISTTVEPIVVPDPEQKPDGGNDDGNNPDDPTKPDENNPTTPENPEGDDNNGDDNTQGGTNNDNLPEDDVETDSGIKDDMDDDGWTTVDK
jgi:serine/threonine protein kinase